MLSRKGRRAKKSTNAQCETSNATAGLMQTLTGPESWTWPNDATLSVFDCEHRKMLCWAIETVNPNAWSAATAYLATTIADIVLVQETKLPEGYPCDAAEQAARNNKWSVGLEPCLETKAGGNSAGVAVCTRSFIGMSEAQATKHSKHLHPSHSSISSSTLQMELQGIVKMLHGEAALVAVEVTLRIVAARPLR